MLNHNLQNKKVQNNFLNEVVRIDKNRMGTGFVDTLRGSKQESKR